jgi:hypothetical protein
MPARAPDAPALQGSMYHYRFVGSGAQFRVYSVYTIDGRSTGRVVKVPLDFAETKQAIFEPLRKLAKHGSDEELDIMADERTREMMRYKYDVPNLLQGVLGRDRKFMRQLGRLRLLQAPIPAHEENTGTYALPTLFTQDHVLTLDEYFQSFRLAEVSYTRNLDIESIKRFRSVIDQMVKLNYAIWEYGVFEFVFKPENFGIRPAKRGGIELIWIDLAEHITDLERAGSILEEKRWLHSLMPHKVDYQFMPTILQDYYATSCNKAFTQEKLRRYWRKKCISAEAAAARRLHAKEILARDDKKVVSYWIARHNVSRSLYRGFVDQVIDDMRIPIADIELLMADKYRLGVQIPLGEENIERRMAESGIDGATVWPLIISPNFTSNEDKQL